jgi:phytoene/squalene synthetase
VLWRRCFPLTDPAAIARGQRLCREIAGRANANFLHAARLLPGFRQNYFFATYAAMRVIDDRVDENFLTLTTEKRDAGRAGARREIADWLNQSVSFGAAVGGSSGGPLHSDGVAALAYTAGRSDLGVWPWQALAEALLSDVEEREMRSWEDFLDYCAGATVAPAAIFIYLLAARYDPACGYSYELPRAAREYAKDLAIYCYIVHILRDLAKDAGRSPRLITIPTEILSAAGLTRAGLSAALAVKSPAIGVLAGLLINKARPFKEAGHAALHEVGSHLGMVERLALNGLIAVYDRLFESAGKDALAVALNGPAMEEVLRRDLLRPAGEG